MLQRWILWEFVGQLVWQDESSEMTSLATTDPEMVRVHVFYKVQFLECTTLEVAAYERALQEHQVPRMILNGKPLKM